MKEDLAEFDKDFDNLQMEVENIDISLKNNNITIRELKEGLEGGYLFAYLVDLFSGWVASECELVMSIFAANHIELFKTTQRYPWENW